MSNNDIIIIITEAHSVDNFAAMTRYIIIAIVTIITRYALLCIAPRPQKYV